MHNGKYQHHMARKLHIPPTNCYILDIQQEPYQKA